jgi:hypothetical protein
MPSPISPRFLKFDELTKIAEQLAKYSAAIGLFALGSALVHDFVFWHLLDARLLSYFQISDHVQSAIETVGGMIIGMTVFALAVGLIILLAVILGEFPNWLLSVVYWLGLVVMVAGLFYGLITGGSPVALDDILTGRRIGPLLVMMLGIGMMAARIIGSAPSLPRQRVYLRKFMRRFGLVLIPMWFFMVGAEAFTEVDRIERRRAIDAVTLDSGNQLFGTVIRNLDRGIMLRDQTDGRLFFIPKEKVHRIEYAPAPPAPSIPWHWPWQQGDRSQ